MVKKPTKDLVFIFKLERQQLGLFINRLFATDGWASAYLKSGQVQLGYYSVKKN